MCLCRRGGQKIIIIADFMTWEERREFRKQAFGLMEEQLKKMHPNEEDSLFYYHPSEDRIVLSHALLWVMSGTLKGKIRQEKYLLLLRQDEEEMLEAFLTEGEEFAELLRYCNIIYDMLPSLLNATHDMKRDKDAKWLAAMVIVAGGFGGDMPEAMANELLDDMDVYGGKVKCAKIERMLPQLYQMAEMEMIYNE